LKDLRRFIGSEPPLDQRYVRLTSEELQAEGKGPAS
jgi:hypothetical protein